MPAVAMGIERSGLKVQERGDISEASETHLLPANSNTLGLELSDQVESGGRCAGGETFLLFQEVLHFSPLLWLRPFPILAHTRLSSSVFQWLTLLPSLSQTQKAITDPHCPKCPPINCHTPYFSVLHNQHSLCILSLLLIMLIPTTRV